MPRHGPKVSETMTNKIKRERDHHSAAERERPYVGPVETNSGGLSAVSELI